MKTNSLSCQARPAVRAGFCLFILIFGSCQTLQQLASIQQPTLSTDRVRLGNLSFEAVDLILNVKINNPNPIGVSLTGFDYDLQIAGSSLVKGDQKSRQTISAGGQSTLQIPVKLVFQDLYRAVQTLKNQDSAAYKIGCGLVFDLPILGSVRIPASQSGKLPMIRLPQIKISSLKIKKMSLTGADLELALGVSNPNAFTFGLKKLNYTLTVNGSSWASGALTDNSPVGKKSDTTIRIPISLDFLEVGQTVAQLLSGGKALDCRLTGDMNVGTSMPEFGDASIPFDLANRISLTR
jgi:LEA14-like dessication related protein